MTNSTFSGNFASGNGGGIANFIGSTLIVTNSTFSANSATIDAGGIFNASGTATVTHSTFSGNSGINAGAILNTNGTVHLAGVVMDTGASGANCSSAMTDNGYNLSDDASCGFTGTGSADNATLNLGTLSGGVHTPQTGSDAIGAIPNGTTVNNNGVTLACNSTTTDQIGSTRPINVGTACTSGAVEVALLLCPTPLAISDTTELANCITWANANPGADTLGLDADITLSAALPQITTEITLEGGGFFVSGADTYRVFEVTSTGNFTVNQIIVQNGYAIGNDSAANSGNGAGIRNAGGTLTVTNSTFANNSVSGGSYGESYGGGIFNY